MAAKRKTREEQDAELARVIAEYAKRFADEAPPLSEEQKTVIARLFKAA